MRRVITATLLPLLAIAGACRTVVALSSPAQFIATKSPHVVWVTKADNSVVALQSPQVVADTIGGFVKGDFIELPLSSVQSVRARQAAPKRTMLLVGGVAVLAIGGVGLAVHAAHSPPAAPVCADPADPEGC